MIHLKCKSCGWRLPFLTNTDRGIGVVSVDCYDLVCPSCGHVLIKLRNGFSSYHYRERNRHKHKIPMVVKV